MPDSKDTLYKFFKDNIQGWKIETLSDDIEGEEVDGLDVDNLKKYTFILKSPDDEEVLIHFTNESITNSKGRNKAQIRFISEYAKKAYNYAKLKKIRFFLFSIYSKGGNYFDFLKNINLAEYIISIETNLDECGVRPDITNLYEVLNNIGNKDFIRISEKEHKSGVEQASFIRIYNNGIVSTSELEKYLMYFDNRPYMKSLKSGDNIVFYPSKIFEKSVSEDSNYPRNLLVFGAPGTGKSFLINKNIQKYKEENGDESIDFERVTFFEDYSYSQFVGGYKPIPVENMEEKISIFNGENTLEGKIVGEHVSYKFVPGPFAEILSKAIISKLKNESKIWILVIEELNRANAASVFGDMFQLLDREDGVSQYEINVSEPFAKFLYDRVINNCDKSIDDISEISVESFRKIRLPENMYIWATMNSADQGVFQIDTAFKRRWSFLYKDIDDISSEDSNRAFIYLPEYNSNNNTISIEKYDWNSFRKEINRSIIEAGFEEDRCIGYWFFNKEEMRDIKIFTEYSVKAYNGDQDAKTKLQQLSNPLIDKLLSYLKQDVFRVMPTGIFNTEFKSLSSIRFALKNFEFKGKTNITLKDILKLNENAFVKVSEVGDEIEGTRSSNY